MFADLWAGPNVQPPFDKGQGGSSKNEGLIVCVFTGPPLSLLFFAPDIALFQHAWAPWRACNVAINRDYRCPIRLFYSISPRPYADRSRVIWTVKAGKGTAAFAMEWKKGKRKRDRERESERGEKKKKRAERIRVKSHFSKPQRVSTELADLPLEKCWGYRGV